MKKTFLILCSLILVSCNKKNNDEKQNVPQKKLNENTKIMNSTSITNNQTLISNIDIEKSLFKLNDVYLKKYKFKGSFIENIKINDLLDKEYREDFFKYLEIHTEEDGPNDEFKPLLFTQLLITRIQQLEDKNAFFLLTESSKSPSIAYGGIQSLDQYLWELFLIKPVFFINESSNYNNIEILEFILTGIATEYLIKDAEMKDPKRMCYCDDLESGTILLRKDKLDKNLLKNFKVKFKNEAIIEIDCSPTFETRENTTEEYYNIKLLIDKEMESKLGVKEKLFYKLRVVPILKDYMTK